MDKLIKSKDRVRDFGEVFTPRRIVQDMLDLLPHDTDSIDSTYLDPACGNGNFLAEILDRKLNRCGELREGLIAVASVYGIDIQRDNVEECKLRLYELFAARFGDSALAGLILESNIVCGDALTGKTDRGELIRLRPWIEIKDFLGREEAAGDPDRGQGQAPGQHL